MDYAPLFAVPPHGVPGDDARPRHRRRQPGLPRDGRPHPRGASSGGRCSRPSRRRPTRMDASGVSRDPAVVRAGPRHRPARHHAASRSTTSPTRRRGGFVERYWSLISVPVLDDDGRDGARGAAHARTSPSTSASARARRTPRERGDALAAQVEEVEADLYARSHGAAGGAARPREVASRRLASLAEVALQLAAPRRSRT